MPTLPVGNGEYRVFPVTQLELHAATFMWALALRVAVLGWNLPTRLLPGDPANEIMDDALNAVGLTGLLIDRGGDHPLYEPSDSESKKGS